MKTILDLNGNEAREFLLKSNNYVNFDIPIYFNFGNLLQSISSELKEEELSSCFCTEKDRRPKKCEYVNYLLLNNKSGAYDWRPFQIIHPVIYVSLVHKITKDDNWKELQKRFKEFHSGSISCISIPSVSETDKSDKGEQVTKWWRDLEQASISLGLDYAYLYDTDITDCYGAIYTHSIEWALHGKDFSKNKKHETKSSKKEGSLGGDIDALLQCMSYGQTNGIPQGSVLMDFIAELVLGYADHLLSEKIKHLKMNDYKILRYRDDYKIFVNNPEIANEILKNLTEVLHGLGFKLSKGKTKESSDVVRSSVKPDKFYWILNERRQRTILKQLLVIKDLSDEFPNSGSLLVALQDVHNRLTKEKIQLENVEVLISILSSIMIKSPRIYPISTAIISKFVASMPHPFQRNAIIKRINNKFKKIPNTGHLAIWLQRMTIKLSEIEYTEKLCRKVNNSKINLWNSSWLNKKMRKIISQSDIMDYEALKSLPSIISSEEVSLFKQDEYNF